MSARELAITLLGLAGTFCMPWPGAVDRNDADPWKHSRALQAADGTTRCGCGCAPGLTADRADPKPEAKRLARLSASR